MSDTATIHRLDDERNHIGEIDGARFLQGHFVYTEKGNGLQ